jgi:hypothetical protein
MVDAPPLLTGGVKYSLLMDVTASKATNFYVKFFDGSDNYFLEIPLQTLSEGTTHPAAYDIVCPAELPQISQILFDFGGNPADIDISISNISLCGPVETKNAKSVSAKDGEVRVYSSDNRISIIAPDFKEKDVSVYNAVGSLLYSQPLNTEYTVIKQTFKTGVYLVKTGNTTHKVLVK